MAAGSLAAQLRKKRSEMMLSRLEAVALQLFEERGFDEVTVEEIAGKALISVRTFYRYFPAKEDVLQVVIDRRGEALRAALAARPADEPPMQAVRHALEQAVHAEDTEILRRWIAVVRATPGVLRPIVGGIHLKGTRVVAEFLSSRLHLPPDALVPATLAAAVVGVVQAAQGRWFFEGGDFAKTLSDSLAVLEQLGSDPGA